MDATDLIFKLRNDGYSIKAAGSYLDISPADNLSPELVRQLKLGKPEILCALNGEEKAREFRREKALDMLAENPDALRVMHTDTESDPKSVVLTIAIRKNMAICEMFVPRDKYDPWRTMLELDKEVH